MASIEGKSELSYEVALQSLRRAASEKGGNVIRMKTAPDMESFVMRHRVGGKAASIFYAEGDVYQCKWDQPQSEAK